MGSIVNITAVILGSVIGAGFASGQEIKIFFSRFGIYGLFGLLFSIFLICVIINLSLKAIFKHNLCSYSQFSAHIFKNNRIFSYSMQNIVNVFLLASFMIMAIGFSTSLENQFSVPRFAGGFIFAFVCYLAFVGNINRVIQINVYIMPILIALILFAGLKVLLSFDWTVNSVFYPDFIFNSFIYASYNAIPLIPILLTLKNEINSIKKINLITALSFVCMCFSAIAVFCVTCSNILSNGDILLVEVARGWSDFESIVFCFVILAAIYTSAVCSGYSFANNISKNYRQYNLYILIMCTVSILISNFNFASTVQIVYALFGVLGLIQICALIKSNK